VLCETRLIFLTTYCTVYTHEWSTRLTAGRLLLSCSCALLLRPVQCTGYIAVLLFAGKTAQQQ
jgi:hypothetical protein